MEPELNRMQVVGVISGALKALGNTHAPITKSLIGLYVAVLACGGVPAVLASGLSAGPSSPESESWIEVWIPRWTAVPYGEGPTSWSTAQRADRFTREVALGPHALEHTCRELRLPTKSCEPDLHVFAVEQWAKTADPSMVRYFVYCALSAAAPPYSSPFAASLIR